MAAEVQTFAVVNLGMAGLVNPPFMGSLWTFAEIVSVLDANKVAEQMIWNRVGAFIMSVGVGLWMILRRQRHACNYVEWAQGRQGFFGTMFPDVERRAEYERSVRTMYTIIGVFMIASGLFYLLRW